MLLIILVLCLASGLVVGTIYGLALQRRLGGIVRGMLLGVVGALGAALLAVILVADRLNGLIVLVFSSIGSIVVLTIYTVLAGQKTSPFPETLPAETMPMGKFVNNYVAPPTLPSPTMLPTQLSPNLSPETEEHEFQVKICPTCRHTYTDITLNFCLNDGSTLSNVLQAKANHDSEETILSPKFR